MRGGRTDFGACVGPGEECSYGGAGERRGLAVGAVDGGDYGLDSVFLTEARVGVSWCLGVWWGGEGGEIYRAWATAIKTATARARVGYMAGEREKVIYNIRAVGKKVIMEPTGGEEERLE